MTSQTRLIAALVAGAAVLIAVGLWLTMAGDRTDGKGWPQSERAAFMRSCLEECGKSPGVTEDKYPLCDRASQVEDRPLASPFKPHRVRGKLYCP